MVHSARPPNTARSSFSTSGRKGAPRIVNTSGERKENLLQTSMRQRGSRTQLVEVAGPAQPAVRKQDNAISNALGVSQLVNSENEGAAARGCLPKRFRYL